MSLDPALFTLHFLPRQSSPSIIDLSTSIPYAAAKAPAPIYTLSRAIRSPTYQTTLLDGLTYTELGVVSASTTAEKQKSLCLYNPDSSLEIKKAGPILRTEWHLTWQGEKLAITKDSLALAVGHGKASYEIEVIRKPDPPIKVATYRPETKKSPAFLQIMDYNIDRCSETITDKRGLEHSIILAIASCLDAEYDERYRSPEENIFLCPDGAVGHSASQQLQQHLTDSQEPLERNEVIITPLVEPTHIVQHCIDLLRKGVSKADDRQLKSAVIGQNLDMIVIKASGEEMAKRAIGIAERVKVGFYRLSSSDKGELWDGTIPVELFQYVRSSAAPSETPDGTSKESSAKEPSPVHTPLTGARPRIKLGSVQSPERRVDASPALKTPALISGITIYLSKTRLEEFEAEQAQQARLYQEKQSRKLAEKLQEDQVRQQVTSFESHGRHKAKQNLPSQIPDHSHSGLPSPPVNSTSSLTPTAPGAQNGKSDSNGESHRSEMVSDRQVYILKSANGMVRDLSLGVLPSEGSLTPVLRTPQTTQESNQVRRREDRNLIDLGSEAGSLSNTICPSSYLDPDFASPTSMGNVSPRRSSPGTLAETLQTGFLFSEGTFGPPPSSSSPLELPRTQQSPSVDEITEGFSSKGCTESIVSLAQSSNPRLCTKSSVIALQNDLDIKVKLSTSPKCATPVAEDPGDSAYFVADLLAGNKVYGVESDGNGIIASGKERKAVVHEQDEGGEEEEEEGDDDDDSNEEEESRCEAECGSWYGSQWSLSSTNSSSDSINDHLWITPVALAPLASVRDDRSPKERNIVHQSPQIRIQQPYQEYIASAMTQGRLIPASNARGSRHTPATLPYNESAKGLSTIRPSLSRSGGNGGGGQCRMHEANNIEKGGRTPLTSALLTSPGHSRTTSLLPPPILAQDVGVGSDHVTASQSPISASRKLAHPNGMDNLPHKKPERPPGLSEAVKKRAPRDKLEKDRHKPSSASKRQDDDQTKGKEKDDTRHHNKASTGRCGIRKSKSNRWSSAPIKELHERWEAEFRGMGSPSSSKGGKDGAKKRSSR